jgi:iron complex outermembrane receptor protein
MRKLITRLSLLLVIAFGMTAVAFAQNARISGNVTDPHGAAVVGAEVQVINLSTGNKFVTKTGDDGSYSAPFLPAGHYQIIVSAKGFSQASKGDLAISEGQVSIYDAKLTIGGTSEQVIVKGATDSIPNANPKIPVGPFTDTALQDLPYSVSVVPHELIENVQVGSPDQLFRMNPVAQLNMPTTLNLRPEFNLRGFTITDSEEDGMRNYNGWVNSLEDVERVEIITGLSGYLYGPGNVGGVVNYVAKRPTSTRQSEVTLGDYGGESKYIHGDFGGPIDSRGKVGYRLNIVAQNGDTAISAQNLNRFLSTAVVDWHASNKLLVQFNSSYQDYNLNGTVASWGAAANVQYPSAPHAGSLWSQPWTYNNLGTLKVGSRVRYDINGIFTLRGGFEFAEYQQKSNLMGTTITSSNTYTEAFQVRAPRRLSDPKGYAYLDAHFNTGILKHILTVGYSGDASKWRYHQDSRFNSNYLTGTFTFQTPLYVAEPTFTVGTLPMYTEWTGSNKNAIVGDEIAINDQWRVMAGLSYVTIIGKSFNTDGSLSGTAYDESKPTPSASLIYKPVPQVSTYFTYMESLEQGVQVPSGYSNTDAMMPPLTSNQYEAGAKANVSGALLTAALFQINRANFYSSPGSPLPTYTQDGREVHKGIEFTATGKPIFSITMVGGITLMNAAVEKTQTAGLPGKRPIDVSDQLAKLYAERSIPGLGRLFVTGGIYYTGHFWADSLNTVKLPAATIGDLGLRYDALKFNEHPLIFRINASNLANKSYWTSSSFEGDPRTIAFSAQMKF